MEELIRLLKDGRSRTLEMLAAELNTSVENVKRDLVFLERTGVIRRVDFAGHSCSDCSGCASGGNCSACMPEGGFKNMGTMWEVNA
ncbi:MAG: DeoR family transcriptional regulator [Lachnospiraceae bacterium]|nr:DeoR family transcriptional regulator [Lachnospiraceae bacterium]